MKNTNILIYLIIILFLIFSQKILVENFPENNNNIWLYWENKKGGTKASYLDLCFETVIKNCSRDSNVNLINEKTVYKFLPDLRKDLNEKCTLPQKADYIRLSLLTKYGGIWLDSDVIVFKSLKKLFLVLNNYDFIGFGCHFKDCNRSPYGYPKPANWVIGSKKNGKLMTNCLIQANKILDYSPSLLTRKYHCLGRELLWKEINKLILLDKNWSYYHFNSRCIERDSNGNKLINQRFLSDEEIDFKCKEKFVFIPIYNTAPGFPNWFSTMSKEEILKQDILFTKMIKYALKEK